MRWIGEQTVNTPISFLGWVRVFFRGFLAAALLILFMPWIVLARFLGMPRVQAWLAQDGSRLMLSMIGLRLKATGIDHRQPGAIVANHSSWLDIFALYAAAPGQFVAKAEVSKWPGIGVLGRLAGTVFIERNPRKAKDHIAVLERALGRRERLIFFPEGTSTDGQRILPFRTTLFSAFEKGDAALQAAFIHYEPDAMHDPRFYGFYADMPFGRHAQQVLASSKRGTVVVNLGPLRRASEFTDRKALAARLEADARDLAPDQIASASA